MKIDECETIRLCALDNFLEDSFKQKPDMTMQERIFPYVVIARITEGQHEAEYYVRWNRRWALLLQSPDFVGIQYVHRCPHDKIFHEQLLKRLREAASLSSYNCLGDPVISQAYEPSTDYSRVRLELSKKSSQ